jgi:YD repeat-containing protein
MTTTTKNSPTTPNGITRLRYDENGVLVEQSLPDGAWTQGPQPTIPNRPKRPGPTPLADILASVENIERELCEATAAYERSLQPGGADPFAREKHTLASKIAALRAELDLLESRLQELQSLPAPAVQFKNSIARFEQQTSGAAMQLTKTLAEAKSEELYQRSLASLPHDAQKLVLNRRDVSVVKDVAAAGFARFGRTPEEVRTAEQAESTAGRISQAIALTTNRRGQPSFMTAGRTRFRSTRSSESRSKKVPGVRIARNSETSILGHPGRFEYSARQSELRFLSGTNSHGLILL